MTFFPIERITTTPALRAQKIRGVHLAIVVDNSEADGNPGFRVKVKLPWMNEEEGTHWARIAVPMAGNERGTYLLPAPEDQVLVVFEHGDINRPIVIGAVWSSQQKIVETNASGKNNTKLIKSKTGHRLIFDDTDGAEKIAIVDKTKRNKIILDSASKLVKIESAGDLEITADKNVIVHAKTLKLGASETFKARANKLLTHTAATLNVKASAAITISGAQVQINVEGGAATSVSGSGKGSLGG